MMDAGGDGRRRGKKKNRQRRKRSKRNRSPQQTFERFPKETPFGDDRSVLAGRTLKSSERRVLQTDGPPDGFTLFCAYHLGITSTDGYQKPQLDEVARRFGMTPKDVKALLGEHGLDDDTIRQTDFDLEGAQLDIRLAPEGISRTEVARDLWQDYLEAKNGA
jgi:hypothetical protein